MASVLRTRSARARVLDWAAAAFRSAGAPPKRRCRSASLRLGVGLPLPTVTPGRPAAPLPGSAPGALVAPPSGPSVVVALRRRNTRPAYRDQGHGLPGEEHGVSGWGAAGVAVPSAGCRAFVMTGARISA